MKIVGGEINYHWLKFFLTFPHFIFDVKYMYGGRSSVGRVVVCGSIGRGFKPRRSPHEIIFKMRKK